MKHSNLIVPIEDRIDLADAKKAIADISKHGTISWESIKKKMALPCSKQIHRVEINGKNDATIRTIEK
jgi:hypothetical protein